MNFLLLNILFGLLLGSGAVMLKLPNKAKTPVRLFTHVLFFIGGFAIGYMLMPAAQMSTTFIRALVLQNPMIFTTKAFKLVVALGTAGAFFAGFKLGKWEI